MGIQVSFIQSFYSKHIPELAKKLIPILKSSLLLIIFFDFFDSNMILYHTLHIKAKN